MRETAKEAEATHEPVVTIDWQASVIDLIPQVYPGYHRPDHMRLYGDVLDESVTQWKRPSDMYHACVLAAPPQHSKTTLTLVALLKAIVTSHGLTHMYASYSDQRTAQVQREAARLCKRLGIKYEGTSHEWWIPETSSRIVWTSIGGLGSGVPVDGLLLIDDPFRDYAQARSTVERAKRWDWLVQVGLARVHRTTWILLMATRWHEDDLSARATARMKWRYINIQALCTDENDGTGRKLGDPLWPAKHTLNMLEAKRFADKNAFEALYQGNPRSTGDALFDEPKRYVDIPQASSFRTAYGADFAYSETTAADWSVLLRGRRVDDKVYLMHGIRKQLIITKFLPLAVRQVEAVRGIVRWYYGGGGEKGVATFVSEDLPTGFNAMPATRDKVVRSLNAQRGWNIGHIVLPEESSPYYGPWVEEVRQECMLFTGQGDEHDDIIDALAALTDELMGTSFNWDELESVQQQVSTNALRRGVVNSGGWMRI